MKNYSLHVMPGENIVITGKSVNYESNIRIEAGASLTVVDSTFEFAPGAGIVCAGKLAARNSKFTGGNETAGWASILIAGKGGSGFFSNCAFNFAGGFKRNFFENALEPEIIEFFDKSYEPMADSGGALTVLGCAEPSGVTIRDCEFRSCRVAGSGRGGAIFACDSTLAIEKTKFVDCSANELNGGAVCFSDCDGFLVSASSFQNCIAGNDGGGLAINDCGGGLVDACEFTGCRAGNGGAIGFNDCRPPEHTLKISSCRFMGCESENSSGGLYIYGSEARIYDSVFEECRAGTCGGGIMVNESRLDIIGCSFIKCSSNNNGGGIFVSYCAEEVFDEGYEITPEKLQKAGVKFTRCSPDDFAAEKPVEETFEEENDYGGGEIDTDGGGAIVTPEKTADQGPSNHDHEYDNIVSPAAGKKIEKTETATVMETLKKVNATGGEAFLEKIKNCGLVMCLFLSAMAGGSLGAALDKSLGLKVMWFISFFAGFAYGFYILYEVTRTWISAVLWNAVVLYFMAISKPDASGVVSMRSMLAIWGAIIGTYYFLKFIHGQFKKR